MTSPCPFLDFAVSQPRSCFGNKVSSYRPEAHFQSKLVTGNDRHLGLASAFSWKSSCIAQGLNKDCYLRKAEVWRHGLMIKAVATLEMTSVSHKMEGVKGYQNALRIGIDKVRLNPPVIELESSSDEAGDVEEREQLRRMRISKANKGNTPWNKGRKHTPETLQKIKERTRLAMQDPKVKMKLVNFGHAQTIETRTRIGVGVRLGWERRRERLKVQETCHFEWQNLIAVATQKGHLGEEELQWDSYEILKKQLEKEWLQSIEQRKNTTRPKGNMRAPKSPEQKRKIAAAIAAKWADSAYRDRVSSGKAKFYGTPEGVERKPKRKQSGDGQARNSSTKEDDNPVKHDSKSGDKQIKLKRNKSPIYKDPMASSKLEMLKSIRAKRTVTISKNTVAITRAKLLIAEAEKAAETLEIAARNNPQAHASLMESRMLIAEAIQFIESIGKEDPASIHEDEDLLQISPGPPRVEEETDTDKQNLDTIIHTKVNGFYSATTIDIEEDRGSSFHESILSDLVKGNASDSCVNEEVQDMDSCSSRLPQLNNTASNSSSTVNLSNLDGNAGRTPVNGLKFVSVNAEEAIKQVSVVKKWVRGRLIQVEEEQ